MDLLGAPAQHLDPHARTTGFDKTECLSDSLRDVDDDAVCPYAPRGPAVQNPQFDRPTVREVRDAYSRSEGIGRMCDDHGGCVEPSATRGRPPVESRPVIRGEAFPHLKGASGIG